MRSAHPLLKHAAVPLGAAVLAIFSIGLVIFLDARANQNAQAKISLADTRTSLNLLLPIAFSADPARGGSPEDSRRRLARIEADVDGTLRRVRGIHPHPALDGVRPRLRAVYVMLEGIRRLNADGQLTDAFPLSRMVQTNVDRSTTDLRSAGRYYGSVATRSLWQAAIASAVAILALLAAFVSFYRRSRRPSDTGERLPAPTTPRPEAPTDLLTGLGTRRAFMAHLDAAMDPGGEEQNWVLVLLDLDGFKSYNDAFGHPAGDALLTRLAGRLANALDGGGAAYRIDGDEFGVLARTGDGDEIAARAGAALSDRGEAFDVSCSYGHVLLPSEASSPEAALALATSRMSARKVPVRGPAEPAPAGHASPDRETIDVLLKVLSERNPQREQHVQGVGALARMVAVQLGLPEDDVEHIGAAAELHDIGKLAIPDAILTKAGTLNKDEWTFLRRHTMIGEQILLAAPSLVSSAAIVRSSHERVDGRGYPDQLAGSDIPVGSRILAVCDAYDAMVSDRSYRPAMEKSWALAELRRCCGTQFDADVVTAFEAISADLADKTPVATG